MKLVDWLTGRGRPMDEARQHIEKTERISAEYEARKPLADAYSAKADREVRLNHLTDLFGQIISGRG